MGLLDLQPSNEQRPVLLVEGPYISLQSHRQHLSGKRYIVRTQLIWIASYWRVAWILEHGEFISL